MKLRNKKTGEIVKTESEIYFDTEDSTYELPSIEALNEEWEDYKEPKTACFIDPQGDIQEWRDAECYDWTKEKQIGNYFETKEEAEKAVEKLKAFKRLKDKGFIFSGVYGKKYENIINFEFGERALNQTEFDEAEKDLDLLFGGEE